SHLVGPLDVDDGDVGADRLDLHQAAGCDQPRIGAKDVAAQQRARRETRHVPGGGPQRERDREVGMVVNLERSRHLLLAGPSVAVAEPFGDVADPRRRDLPDAARPDQLVEESVRYRTDELEVATPLADDLVSGGEGYQGLERQAQGDGRAIWYEPADGFR